MKNILIVEDSAADVALVEEVLADKYFDVELNVVDDGFAAISAIVGGDIVSVPDLVLLDLNLPKFNGLDVLKTIKRYDHTKTIPVIVMSNSSSPEDIRRVYELQASAYVHKAFDLESFQRTIRSLMTYWLDVVTLPPPLIPTMVAEPCAAVAAL